MSLRLSIPIFMLVVQSELIHLPEAGINSHDREYLVYLVKLAKKAGRYDDMFYYVKMVAILNTEASVEERNLLAFAYRSMIGYHRASLRKLPSTVNEVDKNDTRKVEIFRNYRVHIEKEIKIICDIVIGILSTYLIPKSTLEESKVFFYKMKGNCNRYLAEVEEGIARKEAEEVALGAYKSATDIAIRNLASTNPIRLEAALNFSSFYYEILNLPLDALHLARSAVDSAIAELDEFDEELSKDSTFIMQLLRDNIALWTSVHPSESNNDQA